MTDEKDTTPPPPEHPTLTELPTAANDSEPPPPIIPIGFARHAVAAAILDAYRAIELLAATADAVARQLDDEGQS